MISIIPNVQPAHLCDKPTELPLPLSVWQHAEGTMYVVVGHLYDSDRGAWVVAYQRQLTSRELAENRERFTDERGWPKMPPEFGVVYTRTLKRWLERFTEQDA